MLRKENCENNKRVKVEHRGLCSKYIENECMLRKENCENNKRVKVEHRGLCSKYIDLKKIQDQICRKKITTENRKICVSSCNFV